MTETTEPTRIVATCARCYGTGLEPFKASTKDCVTCEGSGHVYKRKRDVGWFEVAGPVALDDLSPTQARFRKVVREVQQ